MKSQISYVGNPVPGITDSGSPINLDPPLLSISTWPDNPPHYTHWQCGSEYLTTSQITFTLPSTVAEMSATEIDALRFGQCQAGSSYAWGFSFLLLLTVCIVNLVVVIVMYVLWLSIRTSRKSDEKSARYLVVDAITLASQAQRQYGPDALSWDARTIKKRVIDGKRGMSDDSKGQEQYSEVYSE